MTDERKKLIGEIVKELEEMTNTARLRFILSVIRAYKKGGAEV